MRFSLIIPCYNEAAALPDLIAACAGLVGAGVEVVLVDNGSTDATGRVFEEHGVRPAPRPAPQRVGAGPCGVLRCVRVDQNRGYGFGILAGLAAATGDVLGWTHADLQTDPSDCLRAFRMFEECSKPQSLFVKGARRLRPLADVIFTAGMSTFESVLFQARLSDINAQPTVFHRSFMESWRSPPEDFSLDLYVYALAKATALDIQRFPVLFSPRRHGRSHWNVDWRGKLRFIRRTLSFSWALRTSSEFRAMVREAAGGAAEAARTAASAGPR